jgi:chemotaxis protein methyltransferase CheR
MINTREHRELEKIEVDLLVEGIRRHYGLDLAHYAQPQLLRRLRRYVASEGLGSISGLLASTLHSPARMEALLATVTSDPSTLFEEPHFFAAFREQVVPWLKTHPSVRVWQAGCASPEEIYSLAILLHEEGLLGRTRLYVTDASALLLSRAQTGALQEYGPEAEANYQAAGGRGSLKDYVSLKDGIPTLSESLQDRIFYSQHHVVHEGAFNEFHAVVGRNMTLYFDKNDQRRIHSLFFDSIGRYGFLGLGRRESLRRTPYMGAFDEIAGAGRLFRRVS